MVRRATGNRQQPQPEVESNEDQEETRTGREVAPRREARSLAPANERNVFENYGDSITPKMIVGQLLKFNKGDWLVGTDQPEEIEPGTKLVVCMTELMVGWIRWWDGKPSQQEMGKLVEGYQPARRTELGDNDKDEWETDNDGKPRDPWQFTNYVLMKPPGKKAKEDNLYTFSTSSRGGLGCMGELCKAFGKARDKNPDMTDIQFYPIVELGAGAYNHPDPQYGRIKFPTLKIVGWEKAELFQYTPEAASEEEDAGDEVEQEEQQPARQAPRRASGGGRSRR